MQKTETIIFRILVWISKGLSILLIAFFLFFLISHLISDGIGSFKNLSTNEILMFTAFLVMITGLSIALKWQGTGGMLTVGGYLIFAILDKNFWPGNIIPIFLTTGLLHIYLWIRLRPSATRERLGKTEK